MPFLTTQALAGNLDETNKLVSVSSARPTADDDDDEYPGDRVRAIMTQVTLRESGPRGELHFRRLSMPLSCSIVYNRRRNQYRYSLSKYIHNDHQKMGDWRGETLEAY